MTNQTNIKGHISKNISLLVYIFVCCALLFSWPRALQASSLAYATERLAGPDRIATALTIAQKGWTTADTVLLCEYDDYADSIAASPLAAQLSAPILLSEGQALDPRVKQEILRLQAGKVILLGGAGRLQPAIEQELHEMSLPWERIGGADRYETSVLLAQRLSGDSVILANGDDFPDALSAASFAGVRQIPIVLTSKSLPDTVVAYFDLVRPQHLIVIGGEGAIPAESLAARGLTAETRLGGKDRFETNAQVVAFAQDVMESNDFLIASGLNFPDAVAGASLAAKMQAPLLLTEKEDIPPDVYSILRLHMKVEPPRVYAVISVSERGTVVASGGLILRDAASLQGKAQLTIPEGTSLDISAAQGDWYKTEYRGTGGWVSANYVAITFEYKKGKVTAAGGLNLRETPAANGKVILTIPSGTALDITDQQGDWYQSTYQNKTGWVSAAYVALVVSASVETPPGSGGEASTASIDLTPNGKVWFLGGGGVISEHAQSIIEGQQTSQYADNQKTFPPLPAAIQPPDSGNPVNPYPAGYDPAQEHLAYTLDQVPVNSLSGKKILLDPGHGGPDPGCIGPGGSYEKNNTLAIALYLKEYLTLAGAEVIMTRESDTSVVSKYTEADDLIARVEVAENNAPDLFISIHNNANDNLSLQGIILYYSTYNAQAAESKQLADILVYDMTGLLHMNNMGVRTANFYVCRYAPMPSVLIELGFMSNAYEEQRLLNTTFRQSAAGSIFWGIYRYLTNTTP
ncbi:MAG: cell wall-binding repeat-containing protein [Peptococcaceae bacterium]|jgi:N-acetylmuramoyl-L-alanine amidase|nr:cell wall-binding repeat-containing protein [Peptococcaceae bacterium]